jgi:dolichol-phosphate hexosyltransferase
VTEGGPQNTGLSVLMPVFNERPTIATAIERVLAADVSVDGLELIVVDDGSTDGTGELLDGREWPENVRIVRHERNRGKGAALRTGLAHASGEYATVMDADLEYDPSNFSALLAPLLAGDADAVYGVRGFQAHSAYSFWYVVGNKAVTLAANVLYNAWLSDLMTCQKVLRSSLFRTLPLRENGFAIEAEITARLLRAGVRIFEVPITYRARRREEGKKLTPLDGLKVIATLARCRVR